MSPLLLALLIFIHITSVRHKCATTFPTTVSPLLLALLIFIHITSVRHKCAITFPTTIRPCVETICATTFPTTVPLLLLSLLIFLHIIGIRHKCAITFPTTIRPCVETIWTKHGEYCKSTNPNDWLPQEPVAIRAMWTVSDTYPNMYVITVGRAWGQNT